MAGSETIREFLVRIGYKVDESAYKKFTGGLSSATSAVMRLGAALEITALLVATAVTKFASNLENLYFVAQRTSSSASGLRAFENTMKHFGGSAEDALSMVDSLAAFLRTNPGGTNFLEAQLNTVGLSARGVTSSLEKALLLSKLFTTLSNRGQYAYAAQLGEQFGFSEQQVYMMTRPGFEAEQRRNEKKAGGFDKAAAQAHKYMDLVRDTQLRFEQSMLRLESRMEDVFGKLFNWFDQHSTEIGNKLVEFWDSLTAVFVKIKPYVVDLVEWFGKINSYFDDWPAKILAVVVALKALGASSLVGGIINLGVALARGLGATVIGAAAGEAWAVAGAAFGAAAGAAILGYLAYKNWDSIKSAVSTLANPRDWDWVHRLDQERAYNDNSSRFDQQVHIYIPPGTANADALAEQIKQRLNRLNTATLREFATGTQ